MMVCACVCMYWYYWTVGVYFADMICWLKCNWNVCPYTIYFCLVGGIVFIHECVCVHGQECVYVLCTGKVSTWNIFLIITFISTHFIDIDCLNGFLTLLNPVVGVLKESATCILENSVENLDFWYIKQFCLAITSPACPFFLPTTSIVCEELNLVRYLAHCKKGLLWHLIFFSISFHMHNKFIWKC